MAGSSALISATSFALLRHAFAFESVSCTTGGRVGSPANPLGGGTRRSTELIEPEAAAPENARGGPRGPH